MYICYFARTENKDEFKAVKENENNPFRILPKPNCKPEGIRDYLRFTLEASFNQKKLYYALGISNEPPNYEILDILYDKEKLTDELIKMYKKLDCYQKQTEEQRKETIEYIKKDPFVKQNGVLL